MNNSIKIEENELFKLYDFLLKIRSKLTLLSSLDNEIVYDSDFIFGIKNVSKDIINDVEGCIKITKM